jgi:predicted nucleic acid-binding protein
MKLEEAVIDINVLVAIIIENGVNHANAREI